MRQQFKKKTRKIIGKVSKNRVIKNGFSKFQNKQKFRIFEKVGILVSCFFSPENTPNFLFLLKKINFVHFFLHIFHCGLCQALRMRIFLLLARK
jgi:hypothetical protein